MVHDVLLTWRMTHTHTASITKTRQEQERNTSHVPSTCKLVEHKGIDTRRKPPQLPGEAKNTHVATKYAVQDCLFKITHSVFLTK